MQIAESNEIALELSPADRVAVIDRLQQSLDFNQNVEGAELSDELRAELDRRLEDARQNPDDVLTWDQVKIEMSRP